MKNSKFILVVLGMVIVGSLASCVIIVDQTRGNGIIVSRERTVGNFSGVVLDGVGNVYIHISEECRVRVTTDSNIQGIIDIKKDGDYLYIDEHCRGGFNPTELTIDVYMPEVTNIKLHGVGNIQVDDGESSRLDIRLTGVGDIEAHNYKVQDSSISISGTGDVKAWVTDDLDGKISGVGNIYYRGSPSIQPSITGIGKIKRL